MAYDLASESWEVVKSCLPKDWQKGARETGALTRARGIKDEESLLRLLLMHTAGGLSLKQTAVRAREQGLAKVSSVALFKRLQLAEGWLRGLSEQLTSEMSAELGSNRPEQRRWRIIDATDVTEPGPTGSSWRVHYSLRLPEMACDFLEVTDVGGGETLKRLPIDRHDVVLADRGYGYRAGVVHAIESGADVVIRFNSQSFPLCDENGKKVNLLAKLRRLRIMESAEWSAGFQWKGQFHRLRVCAIKKSALHAARARRKAKRKNARNGYETLRPETLELANYVIVMTTLPASTYPVHQILEIYRWRWQIELAFKRLKGLLALGHVPKTDPSSSRGWLQGKILAALLIDKILRKGRFFSPWGYNL